jgi:rod shape-determining protein MreD
VKKTMISLLTMGLVLFVAALIQGALPGYALLGQAKFPFLLSAVVYYALNRERLWMVTAAFVAGLLHDALSAVPLAASALLYLLAGWIVSCFRKQVDTDALVTYSVFGLSAAAAVSLVTYMVLQRGGHVDCSATVALWRSLGAAALGTVTGPVVFKVLRALDRAVGNVEVREGVRGFR